jgi:hypothetical protein
VSTQRVLAIGQGRFGSVRSIEPASIDVAVPELQGVTFDRADLKVRIRDGAIAAALAKLVNTLIIAQRPRSIPKLHPRYFEQIFTRSPLARTPLNMARLIERTAFMIGGQGAAYCAQMHDAAAFDALLREFGHDDLIDRGPDIADEIIDWLWQWNPFSHRDLTRRVAQWAEGIVQPGKLMNQGRDIPAWSDGKRRGNATAWRMVFDSDWK